MQLVLGTAPAPGAATRRPRRVAVGRAQSLNGGSLRPLPKVVGEGATHCARGGRGPLLLNRYGSALPCWHAPSAELLRPRLTPNLPSGRFPAPVAIAPLPNWSRPSIRFLFIMSGVQRKRGQQRCPLFALNLEIVLLITPGGGDGTPCQVLPGQGPAGSRSRRHRELPACPATARR